MTQAEFYRHLTERAKKYGFRITKNRAGFANELIREKRTCKCPVVAVAVHLGYRGFGEDDNMRAAQAMGLNPHFCERVATAADVQMLVGESVPVRRKLVKLLGLEARG